MKAKVLSIVLLINMGFIACKKESTTPPSTQDRIAGKWQMESSAWDHFYSGVSHIVNYTGTAADYVDFRSDGKVYSFVGGSYDTVAYAIISDTKMWFDASSEIYDIQTLTGSSFKVYRKEIVNAGEYNESTINMKR